VFGKLLLIMKRPEAGQEIGDCGFSESRIINAGSGLPARLIAIQAGKIEPAW
jgi:hypothetical protein